jgi:hypothetical protein
MRKNASVKVIALGMFVWTALAIVAMALPA